ncbi:MAG: PQQ-binding-like beta-propeller repeat protein, partial [Acidobacteriota bacterium]
MSSQSKLMALRAKDGSELWSVDLAESGPVPRFGYSISPLVEDGVVIVEMGPRGSSPGVTAYHVETGAPKWNALTGPAGYSSPIVVEMNGGTQFILFRASGRELVGLSTRGEVLWRHPTPEALSTIPTPIFIAPDRIFVSTSEDDFGGRMFRILASDDGYRVEQLWQERLMRNHFNSSVLVGEHLYGFDNGTLRCLDAETGAKVWAKRGFGKGSLVSASGLLLILGDNGELALARASPDRYEELGRKQV